ncbi:enoyl-CoA hydratase/isomerase family protein [Gordonia sp. (in: high G+C Gram-positive bacteria)]|uniref:enoyl-CoA hydratase/isomerase family protein n=1 Tax=Gordonia sp. (in: high G+C Gram-positive bacteria) TaxID=84139 RepID=UPI0039E55FAF
MSDSTHVTSADGVLTIAVSTPANGTAMDPAAVDEAAVALADLRDGARDEKAILLVGTGKNLCAGGNVASFAAADDRGAFLADLADRMHAMMGLLLDSGRPVVVAAKGWAAGAGMSFTLLGDVVIGGPSTKMRPAYRGIGLSPDGAMTWTLPRAVGAARARHIILTDQVIGAEEALGIGLLSEIVDDELVDGRAREVAVGLAAGPAAALQATTALLRAGATSSLTDQFTAESASIARLASGPEGVEGVNAFVEKRTPTWP